MVGASLRISDDFQWIWVDFLHVVQARLASFGPVRGFVVGHFAEGSEHMEALLTGAAHCGSLLHWAGMRAREPIDALGAVAWLLRRRWGMTA